MPRQITKRDFIKSAGAAGLALSAGVWPSRVQAQSEVLVLRSASIAIDILTGLMGKPDVLGAMMGTQLIYLRDIVSRLDSIQIQLNSISAAIGALPDTIRRALDDQFRSTLITDIGAQALRYSTLLRAYQNDPRVFTAAASKAELQDIYFRVSSSASTLSITPDGAGPQAAMVAPLALCLDVACRSHVGVSPEVILQTIETYDAWLARMPSAISQFVQTAVHDHDAIVSLAAKSDDGKLASIDHFSLAGDQVGTAFADPCIMLCTPRIKTDLTDNRTRHGNLLYDGACSYTLIRSTRIKPVENADFGVILLQYPSVDSDDYITYYPALSSESGPSLATHSPTGPRIGEMCYVQMFPDYRFPYRRMSTDEIKAQFDRSDGRLAEVQPGSKYPDPLAQYLAGMNEARSRIGFAAKASTLVAEARRAAHQMKVVI